MQRDAEPRGFALVFFHEVGVDAAEDGLVGYYEDVFGAFEFHDYGFEADDYVAVSGEEEGLVDRRG